MGVKGFWVGVLKSWGPKKYIWFTLSPSLSYKNLNLNDLRGQGTNLHEQGTNLRGQSTSLRGQGTFLHGKRRNSSRAGHKSSWARPVLGCWDGNQLRGEYEPWYFLMCWDSLGGARPGAAEPQTLNPQSLKKT